MMVGMPNCNSFIGLNVLRVKSLYFISRNSLCGSMSNMKERSGVMQGQCITKRRFIKEIDGRLNLHNLNRSERIARITLHLLSLKLSQEQKKQFKKLLPPGIRGLWTTVEQPGSVRSNMIDYLTPIKKQGRLQSMEEAFIAAREVFFSLKTLIPDVAFLDISRSMPKGLQEIWDSA